MFLYLAILTSSDKKFCRLDDVIDRIRSTLPTSLQYIGSVTSLATLAKPFWQVTYALLIISNKGGVPNYSNVHDDQYLG